MVNPKRWRVRHVAGRRLWRHADLCRTIVACDANLEASGPTSLLAALLTIFLQEFGWNRSNSEVEDQDVQRYVVYHNGRALGWVNAESPVAAVMKVSLITQKPPEQCNAIGSDVRQSQRRRRRSGYRGGDAG